MRRSFVTWLLVGALLPGPAIAQSHNNAPSAVMTYCATDFAGNYGICPGGGGGGGTVTQGTGSSSNPWWMQGLGSAGTPAGGVLSVQTPAGVLLPVGRPDVRGTLTVAANTLNAAATLTLNNGTGITGFTVTGLTASGATLVSEGSNDGGTTWNTVQSSAGSTGVLSSTYTADGNFRLNSGGRTNLRLRISIVGTGTITVVSNQSVANTEVAVSTPLPPGANLIGYVNTTNISAGYAGGIVFSPPTSPSGADLFIVRGSSTKIVRVLFMGYIFRTTAAAAITYNLIKYSTPPSGGVATNVPLVALDSTSPTATAVCSAYTTAPTPGTPAGTYESLNGDTITTVGSVANPLTVNVTRVATTPAVVLRNANEYIAINLTGTALTGLSMTGQVIITESAN